MPQAIAIKTHEFTTKLGKMVLTFPFAIFIWPPRHGTTIRTLFWNDQKRSFFGTIRKRSF